MSGQHAIAERRPHALDYDDDVTKIARARSAANSRSFQERRFRRPVGCCRGARPPLPRRFAALMVNAVHARTRSYGYQTSGRRRASPSLPDAPLNGRDEFVVKDARRIQGPGSIDGRAARPGYRQPNPLLASGLTRSLRYIMYLRPRGASIFCYGLSRLLATINEGRRANSSRFDESYARSSRISFSSVILGSTSQLSRP